MCVCVCVCVCVRRRFLVSVCYSRAKVAAACAGIVYFLSYVPYMYVAIREEAAGDHISAAVKALVVSIHTSCILYSPRVCYRITR